MDRCMNEPRQLAVASMISPAMALPMSLCHGDTHVGVRLLATSHGIDPWQAHSVPCSKTKRTPPALAVIHVTPSGLKCRKSPCGAITAAVMIKSVWICVHVVQYMYVQRRQPAVVLLLA